MISIPNTINAFRRVLTSAIGFTCIQIAIFSVVGLASLRTFQSVNAMRVAPAFNNEPRKVDPLYDYDFVVSDEQLAVVLGKLHPRFLQNPTKVNFVDHAIRMWDDEAVFSDDSLSGKRMLELLTNHSEFEKVWGATMPLVQSADQGIVVNTQQGRASVSHVDHLMGTLAEIGVPLSHPVQTPEGIDKVENILKHSMMNLCVNQREYEWSTLAAAFYAADGRAWKSADNQTIDFNVLARRIMRQQQPQGVCYGQHRLYTLTILLRIDSQISSEKRNVISPMLSGETRSEILAYLFDMTGRLYRSQSAIGYWDGNWADASKPVPDPNTAPLSRRILATGHVLEWWAMAPKELHPPRATVVKAAQWLAAEIDAMDQHRVEKNYTFLTHAGRALALWRGCFPAEFERKDREWETHMRPREIAVATKR